MKALSLTQPWASLVVAGAKKLETRSWPTYYRGPLLIHAAKGFPLGARAVCHRAPFCHALAAAGFHHVGELPLGQILGIVTLTGCISTAKALEGIDASEHSFGDYGVGRFAWQFTEPLLFDEAIPCRGSLGLWKVPDEIARALELRLGERVA
jgi:hypothetical protein